MPKKLNFILKKSFKSSEEMDEFRENYIWKGKFHNNRVSCCLKDSDVIHKMNYYSHKCCHPSCHNECNVKYLFKYCAMCKRYDFYTLNEHGPSCTIDAFAVKIIKKRHGIKDIIKEIIEIIINSCNIIMPKDIHVEMHKSKYKVSTEDMSTLKQLQNYIAHRRKAIGDCNDLETILNYINGLLLKNDIDENDMFAYGQMIGRGSDEDHFQVITQLKLVIMVLHQYFCI